MDMVERVARALAKLSDDLGYDEGKWRYCEQDARAAIGAMREPTEAMLEANIAMYPFSAVAWRGMIDAALTSAPYSPAS